MVVPTVLTVVLAVGLTALALRRTEGPPPAPPHPPVTTTHPPSTPSPPPPPGPPVLAVKVDNLAEARPPVGIGAADEIYVEPVEGGLSRLLAVFASHQPAVVGPVRSARETDLQLLPQFGHPTLAFSGAAPGLLPRIASAPLQGVTPGDDPRAYFRDDARVSPHNLFLHPDRLPPGAGWSPGAAPLFGPTPPGGTPTQHQEVHYVLATIGFDWSPADGRWLVSMDGGPYSAADSGRLAASTVVIQQVPIGQSSFSDVKGTPSPIATTIGSGHALVLRDGQAFEANWSRPAPDAGTTYTTTSGQPLPFAPGQVWTVFTG